MSSRSEQHEIIAVEQKQQEQNKSFESKPFIITKLPDPIGYAYEKKLKTKGHQRPYKYHP
jgi:hypothetical protein